LKMDIESFREYCLSFKGVTEKFPFDESTLVFYVQGKMFCLTDVDAFDFINVKCDPEKAIALRERYPAVLPGYHMSKKHWNSLVMDGSLPVDLVKEWIRDSYDLVVATLPRKLREELGVGY
jgi:predicted DNA-binding protein (MmcQ/YjbR family)